MHGDKKEGRTMSKALLGISLASGVMIAVACGPKQTDGPGVSTPPTGTGGAKSAEWIAAAEKACDAWFAAKVEKLDKCGLDEVSAEHRTAYMARRRAICVREMMDPGTSQTAERLSACAQKIASSQGCETHDFDCDFPAGTLANGATCERNDQCQSDYCNVDAPALAGTGTTTPCAKCAPRLADGAKCTTKSTCQEGSRCINGACKKAPDADVGGSCAESFCKTGLVCDSDGMKCAQPGAAGTACRENGRCATGLFCDNGKCAARGAVGAACKGPGSCAHGLACLDGKCADRKFAKPGADCRPPAIMCETGDCHIDSGTGKGTCPQVVADNGACGGDASKTCDDFAYCSEGKCKNRSEFHCN
jgi:hypothetical protein